MSFLASFFTIHFLLLLMATLLASARGWRLAPFFLLGLSQIPKLYAHATPLSLDPHDLMTLVMVNGTVMWILYIGLGLMILLPRRDPTKSSLPTILVAVLVASIPWLTLQYLGGELEALTGGRIAAGARRATAGDIANTREQTPLPDRLVGRWQGTAVIDPEGIEREFEDQKTLPDDRRRALKLVEQIEFTVVYRSDGTSTTTIKNAVIFKDRRVGTVMTALAYPGNWALIEETPHSLQIESLANGAVVAITFLGDDTLLYNRVNAPRSGFVDHYRLERHSGGWW